MKWLVTLDGEAVHDVASVLPIVDADFAPLEFTVTFGGGEIPATVARLIDGRPVPALISRVAGTSVYHVKAWVRLTRGVPLRPPSLPGVRLIVAEDERPQPEALIRRALERITAEAPQLEDARRELEDALRALAHR